MPPNASFQQLLIGALGGYLLGSISFAILVAKAKGVDIRKEGSGNPGATNVKRVLGKGAGNLVFLLDFLKGFLPAALPFALMGEGAATVSVTSLLAAILGHSFPVFFRFMGGKGVATTMGGLFGMMPVVMLIGLGAWVAVFYITRVVSIASIAFGLALPACAWGIHHWKAGWFVNILGGSGTEQDRQTQVAFSLLISMLILVRHRSNISRLLSGQELAFKKGKEDSPPH
jgi:glycerol-3-phosphate acyltransferase PlsY